MTLRKGLPTILIAGVLLAMGSTGAAAETTVRHIGIAATTVPHALQTGVDAVQSPEFDVSIGIADSPSTSGAGRSSVKGGGVVNRSIAKAIGKGERKHEHKKAKSNPELKLQFQGLNFRDQRLANGGNQFSVEPPDQGLCAGNGFVLEVVNDVMRVYDTHGVARTGVIDLNTFYGYPAAIDRTAVPLTFGPDITDPSCHFDADTQRWFMVVLTLDRAVPTSQALSGKNHLDIAVSVTPDPTGAWRIYRLPTQDDGTDGTPGHANCPCLGDYPHIGADATGFYITTNEFPLFVDGYNSAHIYAMSKRALAAGNAAVAVVQIDTIDTLLDGTPGFTVWPAISPGKGFAHEEHGTEYFLSSQAVFNDSGTDNRLRIWALTNTRSLDSDDPDLELLDGVVNVDAYSVPPPANQKAGDYPLGQRFGQDLGVVDTNDSRMQQVSYANGKLWGALDTAVEVGGEQKAGIAYYVLDPKVSHRSVTAKIKVQGTVALTGNNLSYPAIAVLENGRGAMAFTVVGDDHFPSAGYAGIDAEIGVGEIHIAAEGLGPQDGFSEYEAVFGSRPRWGDYGAAATDGKSIWLASEYVAQTCDLPTYLATAGSCGGTRATNGNWATSITRVTP